MDPCLAVGGTAKYMNLSSAELADRQRLHLYRPQSAVATTWDGTAVTFDIGAAVSTEKRLGAERRERILIHTDATNWLIPK